MRILPQSVLSRCGHCSQPAEGEVYDQPGLHQYMKLENALMTADTSADELKSVVSAYPEMDAYRLAVQLAMLRQQNWKLESVEDVATKLASAH